MQINKTTAPDPRARRKAAETRVRVALHAIEAAQGQLEQACQALSSVIGMHVEWQKVSKAYDQVKATWYVVEKRAERLRLRGELLLDHEPGAHEAHWSARLEGR